jgi:hypothetical protein
MGDQCEKVVNKIVEGAKGRDIMSDYFNCPNCGAEVPIKAKSCPDCGSDEKTGWSEDTMYDGLDLPALEESDMQTKTSMFQSKIMYYIVAILTIVAFVLFYIL